MTEFISKEKFDKIKEEQEALQIEKEHHLARTILFHNRNPLDMAEIMMKRSQRLIKDLLREGFDAEQISLICTEVTSVLNKIDGK